MKVFIAIPCYSGSVESGTCESLINNVRILENEGHSVKVHFDNGCCYVDLVRNRCVAEFLKTDYDFFIFVDSDLRFDDDAMVRMIGYDRDIILGAYPYRNRSNDYPVLVNMDDTGHAIVDDCGLLDARQGPTGLMCIRRSVFARMIKEHPEWSVLRPETKERLYTFFQTGKLVDGDDRWYGEDVLFCHRWVCMGGKIWIMPNITFEHIGKIPTIGNYKNMLLDYNKEKVDIDKLLEEVTDISKQVEQMQRCV